MLRLDANNNKIMKDACSGKTRERGRALKKLRALTAMLTLVQHMRIQLSAKPAQPNREPWSETTTIACLQPSCTEDSVPRD